MDNYLVVTTKPWNIREFDLLSLFVKSSIGEEHNFSLITHTSHLSFDLVKAINPKKIFFPHWSWKIPKEIYENWECIVFHMTDLPFGRGGSPLQNLIKRGIKDTKISAIKVVEELDAGPIYIKEDLSLEGSALNIFGKFAFIVFRIMIPKLIKEDIIPVPQEGEIVIFDRLKPEDGCINCLDDINKVYDYIRMLDIEGYPKAFLETDAFNMLFFDSSIDEDGVLHATVDIFPKKREQ